MRWLCSCLVVCFMMCMSGCALETGAPMASDIVLLDPGHGGFDGGTSAEDGTLEKHLNLAIALAVRDMLFVCGVPVEMTRSTDQGLEEDASASIHNKKVSDMHRRLAMYNASALVISIHQNHFSVPKYSGAQIFYSANHADSVALAECIRSAITEWVQPLNTRELKKATDSIYLLRYARVPAILVECGFLSNPDERDKLKQPAYQQQMAFAVMAGYWNYKLQK